MEIAENFSGKQCSQLRLLFCNVFAALLHKDDSHSPECSAVPDMSVCIVLIIGCSEYRHDMCRNNNYSTLYCVAQLMLCWMTH